MKIRTSLISSILLSALFFAAPVASAKKRGGDGGDTEGHRRKGVELMHAKLHDLLKKSGVAPIQSIGVDFDPNIHQAVMHEVSPRHREGEVIDELRRGYMINGRLLRPSMVKVAKA